MPVNPKFLAARAAERRQRDLIHLRAFAWLPIERRGRVFARVPLSPLTLRHSLELREARNAFFHPGYPALLGDVFIFLWRLHPHYRPPVLGRAAYAASLWGKRFHFLRMWYALGSLRAALAHGRISALVRRCDLPAAVMAIEDFIERVNQDAAGEEVEGKAGRVRSLVAPERQMADNLVRYLVQAYGITPDQALDLPLALNHQLYRDQVLSGPDAELKVFAPSDALLATQS